MLKWVVFLLIFSCFLSFEAQTIPKDFKPEAAKNQPVINKHITQRDGKAFNNLNHPLSITGGGLILTGAALYIIGSESKEKKPITDSFLENYTPENSLQYIGIGTFAAGAVLFTLFSTDSSTKMPKRKTPKKYDASEWEIQTE